MAAVKDGQTELSIKLKTEEEEILNGDWASLNKENGTD